MSEREPPDSQELPPDDERWRALLTGAGPHIGRMRRVRALIPSSPRCKMCAAPFSGIGGVVMARTGHRRWAKNPKYCTGCFETLRTRHGGAEIECSFLFADVRGSTPMAERLSTLEFTRLMSRFYDRASDVLVDHSAIVDKFVGDEVIAIFVPALAGDAHAARAIAAARALLRATGHGDAGGPWLPVGVGVNTGRAWVGAVGSGLDTEMSALGDVVNVTARLASVAGPGEILVTSAAAVAAQLGADGRERRTLQLKGKTDTTEVVVLSVSG